MHVSWVSGTPYAHALLRHGRADRQRGLRRRGEPPSSTTSPRTSRPAERSGRSGRPSEAGRRAGIPTGHAAARPHARGCDALPPPRGRALARGRPLEPRRRPPRRSATTARSRPPTTSRRGEARLLGGDGRDGLDPGARRGRSPRRGARGRRVLQALRHLVRSAGGRRSRSDLRGRLCGGDGLRRARGLGDGATGGRLDARPSATPTTSPSRSGRCSAATASDARRRPGLARRTSTCTRSG